ncbi:MAG: alginate export family protein [Verrucomicrobiota bacterium JB022]|nr:alginate export family protein [Verrucomicrobiota bacterium JB022]
MHLTQIRSARPALAAFGTLLLCSAAGAAETPLDALAEGKANLTLRPRYESADQDGLDTSHAATLKTLLGYTTEPWQGFSAQIEFTDTRVLDDGAYNAAGLNGEPGKTVVADPETTELNQAYLQFANEYTLVKGGRQRLIYDNARFIGNVGWRQNEQTFDAGLVRLEPVKGLKLDYAYLDHVNRIFADERDWESDSHLIHLAYAITPTVSVGAYAYLLDLEGAGASETETFGGFVAGSLPLDGVKLTYRAEAAWQDRDDANIDTWYTHLQGGAEIGALKLGLGYELLGSDEGKGQFLTPLATAHAYNGFADAYLDNGGAGGLQDFYASVGYKVGKLGGTVFYHHFQSDEGEAADGDEVDLVLTYPIHEKVTALVKVALYDGDTRADVSRVIAELTFAY